MREATKRMIYDHNNIYDDCVWEGAKQDLIDSGNEDPTDNEVWDRVYLYDEDDWGMEKARLKEVFDNGKFLAVGICGRWNGNFAGGFIFDNLDELLERFRDCNLTIWDENGHFFIEGSHHDGTHHVEIRQLTPKGEQYYENWEWGDDNRTEQQCHQKLFTDSHYSKLIHFAHKFYGCPKIQYEKKEDVA